MLLLSLPTVFSHTAPPYGSPVVSPSYASLLSIRLPIGHSASVLQPALPRTHLRCFYSTIPPAHPSCSSWPKWPPNPRVSVTAHVKPYEELLAFSKRAASLPDSEFFSLFIQLIPHPDYPIAPFLLYRRTRLIQSRWRLLGIRKRPSSRHWSTA